MPFIFAGITVIGIEEEHNCTGVQTVVFSFSECYHTVSLELSHEEAVGTTMVSLPSPRATQLRPATSSLFLLWKPLFYFI